MKPCFNAYLLHSFISSVEVDRSKDVIISGGKNRDVFDRHPVLIAAVVAQLDADWGESSCAETEPLSMCGRHADRRCRQRRCLTILLANTASPLFGGAVLRTLALVLGMWYHKLRDLI